MPNAKRCEPQSMVAWKDMHSNRGNQRITQWIKTYLARVLLYHSNVHGKNNGLAHSIIKMAKN